MKKFLTKNKILFAIGGFALIVLPIILLLVKTSQDTRSRAIAGTVAFSFVDPVKNVPANTDFEVDVMVNPNGVAVRTFDFTVKYPKNMVTFVSFIANGNVGITEAGSAQPVDQGEFTSFNFSGYVSPNISTQISIGKLKFHVASTITNGTLIPIDFTQAIAANSVNGVITSHPVDISSTGRYTVGTTQTSSGVNFFFEPALSTVSPGQPITLSLKANTNTLTLQSFDINVTYPTDKLQIINTSTDVTKGPQILTLEKPATPGLLHLVGTGATSLNGASLTIATIKFTALANAPLGAATVGITVIGIDPANTKSSIPGTITIQTQGANPTATTVPNSPTATTTPCTTGNVFGTQCPTTTPVPPTATPIQSGPTPTPTRTPINVCTAVHNRAITCDCTNDTQCRSTLCSNNKCAPRPTQTIPQGNTGLKFSATMPGIGQKLSNNEDNPNPVNSSRMADIKVFDATNTQILQGNSKRPIVFNPATFKFEGAIDLGTAFVTGSYTVKVALDNTLWKLIPGIVTITQGNANNTTTSIALIPGDINQNNQIEIQDWNNMIACNGNLPACTADIKAEADLNDDGIINQHDVDILQRGFYIRNGD